MGDKLKFASKAIMWWLGDWCRYGERRWGEMYSQALEATDYAYQTCRDAAWLATAVPLSRRRDNLPFTHHKEVAGLSVAKADASGPNFRPLRDRCRRLHSWSACNLGGGTMRALPIMVVAVAAVAGCVDHITLPVVGQMDDGTVFQGQTTGRLNGIGDFQVQTIDGHSCSGRYNSLDESPTIRADLTCSDGRTGTLLSTRTADYLSGTGRVMLSDGAQGQFVFGDLVYSAPVGTGGATVR